jgi:hypothetical protein
MYVNDFFKGVSDALAANRSNAGLFFAVILFCALLIFLYFKYFYKTQPETSEDSKKDLKINRTPQNSVNHLIENIFGGETSHEALSLKNLINYYIDRYIENSLDALTINALNTKYWDLVTYIINKKFKNNEVKSGDENNLLELVFTNDEKKVIDFAYLSNRLILSSGSFDESSINESLSSNCYIKEYDIKFYTITSWLSESLKDFTSATALERLDLEYEIIESKIKMANQEKEISLKTRKLLLYEIAKQNAGTPLVKALMATSEKIDRIIDAYSFYKYKTGSGFSMSKNELLEFVNIENFLINSLRNERREELKNIAYGERYNTELISLETELINKEYELLNFVSLKAKCLLEINKHVDCQKNTNATANIEFLNSKIEYIKNTLALVAKRNEIEPILFMTKKIYKNIPDTVYQIIAKFIEADPMVFKSKLSKSAGIPFILFVPGCGNGIYNVETNTLILPEFPIKDYNELVISALALYRWESDDEGNLKRSFHSLKCNKRLSFASLQQAFVKDYALYITKEKESSGLDKEITDWFKFEISPKKGEEIKIQVKKRETVNKNEAAPETSYNTVKIDNSGGAEEIPQQAVQSADKSAETPSDKTITGPDGDGGTEITVSETQNQQTAAAGVISEQQLKRTLVYDKLKLLFKNGEAAENRISIDFIDDEHNFNIEFKNMSVKDFDELFKIIYDNPKIKDYLSGLFKK